LQGCSGLTTVAPRDGIGKRRALTDRVGSRNGLTAVALPDGSEEVRNFTAQFRGRNQPNSGCALNFFAQRFRRNRSFPQKAK
jgi:hypothetical protein